MSATLRSSTRVQSVCSKRSKRSGAGEECHSSALSFRELFSDDPRIHSAAIKRYSDDGGGNTAIGQRAKVAKAAETARCEDREIRCFGDVFHQRKVRSTHCFLAVYSGNKDARERESVQLLHQIEYELWLGARPAMRQNFSVSNIRGDDYGSRKKNAHFHQPVRILQGARANDHPLSAVIEDALNRLSAPDAAANLHLYIRFSKYSLYLGSVVAVTGDTVEIDYVQMFEAVLPPCDCDSNRIRDSKELLIVRAGR